MNQKTTEKILNETRRGYDLMADKFSQTRKYFWRGLEFIADYAKKGNKILDFGCGNGRLLELVGNIENLQYYGLDISQKLVDIAKQNHQDRTFQKINPLQTTLPFTDDYFNIVCGIAVFHHFPSKKYREDLAKELHRITKKNGPIVITVWNLWQKRYIRNIVSNWKDKIFDRSLSPHQFQNKLLNILLLSKLRLFLRTLVFENNWYGDELDWNDCRITFRNNQGKIFNRYHHAFTKKELKNLFKKAGFRIEKCAIINRRNILLIGRK